MNSECVRIADQLNRAFTGEPWYGSPLREILSGVTAGQAHRRPLPFAHTIRELVLHIELWVTAALEAVQGIRMPRYGNGADWPPVTDHGEADWTATVERLFLNANRLVRAIEGFTDEKLKDTVPGREYDFYHVFHGVVQHSIYHSGQIAILKKA